MFGHEILVEVLADVGPRDFNVPFGRTQLSVVAHKEKVQPGLQEGICRRDSHGMSLLAARHASTASRTCLHGSVSRCKTGLCWGCSLRGLQLAAETKSKRAKLDNRIFGRFRFHCRSRFRCWLVVTRNIKSKFQSSRPSKLTGLYPIKKRTRTNPTRWPKSETSEVAARFVMMQHCATVPHSYF